MKKLFNTIVFISLCILAPQAELNGADDPAKLIGDIVTRALEIVNSDEKNDQQKRDELSSYINNYLDVDRVAQAVFSRRGYKSLEEADKTKVKAYLKKYLLNFYASEGKLSKMRGTRIKGSLKAKARGNKSNDFEVITQFEKDGSEPVKIVWVTDGKKIFYVVIEGINQIVTLKSEMEAAVPDNSLMEYINAQS